MRRIVRLAGGLALALSGCARAPLAGPLAGIPVARGIPSTGLAPGHRRLVFDWSYDERVFSARGSGLARLAAPDSMRIDLFLANGNSGGFVIVIADSLVALAQDEARRSLPPAPMLWAALGVVRVTAPDTLAHQDGDTLRVEIGRNPSWRVTFGQGPGAVMPLTRLQRIAGGRVEQTIERHDSTRVVYRQPGAGRSLVLTIRQFSPSAPFDASIWRP